MTKHYFTIDSFSELRKNRQVINNEKCANSFLKECVNEKEKKRTFNYLLKKGIFESEDEIISEMKNNPAFKIVIGMNCSKSSSRQGSKDEALVINGIKGVLEPRLEGFKIDNLSVDDKVPIRRTGEVLSRKEAKKLKYSKTEMLKSFDFEGKVGGRSFYGSAKILVGKGGHQDNVLHEEADLLRWLKIHRKEDCFYFVLLDFEDHDPKDIEGLKDSNDMDNVFICDHIEMQRKMEELNEQ